MTNKEKYLFCVIFFRQALLIMKQERSMIKPFRFYLPNKFKERRKFNENYKPNTTSLGGVSHRGHYKFTYHLSKTPVQNLRTTGVTI